MAGHKVGSTYKVRRFYGVFTETQMRHGSCTRLFTIVHKISLCIHRGIFANNFYTVLVGTHGTIGAKAKKQSLSPFTFVKGIICIILKAGKRHIIIYTNGKMFFWCIFF